MATTNVHEKLDAPTATMSTFNLSDFDFLDTLTTTPPCPTQGAPQVPIHAIEKNTDEAALSTNEITTTRRKNVRTLALRIAKTDELVQRNFQLQKQLQDFQSSAADIQKLYEEERVRRRRLDSEQTKLSDECSRLDAELAHRTLQFDQLQAQWDATKGPLEYGALAVRYLKLVQKLEEAKLLHWSEQTLVEDITKYCQQHQLNVPVTLKSPSKKRKRIYKSEKEIQCDLWQEQPQQLAATLPPLKEMRSQGTQHISTTTTRSTSTACFIKYRTVGTSFPERAPLPSFDQILKELSEWNCKEPIDPIIDFLPTETPIIPPPPPSISLPQLKSQGTCTFLCNIQRQIDFLPLSNSIKRSNSRPPSRLAFDASIKHEMSTSPLVSPSATAPPTTATNVNSSNTSTRSHLLQLPSVSALSHMSPDAFEQLWQVFGQMLLGLLQSRTINGGATGPNYSGDALNQQEFHNWMRSLYDSMQHQQEQQHQHQSQSESNEMPPFSALAQPLDSSIIHRPEPRRDCYEATLVASEDDIDGNSSPGHTVHLPSPQHQSIGTSPIHFIYSEDVPMQALVISETDTDKILKPYSKDNYYMENRQASGTSPIHFIHPEDVSMQVSVIRENVTDKILKPFSENNYHMEIRQASGMSPFHFIHPEDVPMQVSVNENATDKILQSYSDDDYHKENREEIEKLLKRRKRKKKSKHKNARENNYISNVAVETAVDFLATLDCFKVKTVADEITAANVGVTDEIETSPVFVEENIEKIGPKNEEKNSQLNALVNLSNTNTFAKRQREVKRDLHSLFGSDTDMETTDEEAESVPQKLISPTTEAVIDTNCSVSKIEKLHEAEPLVGISLIKDTQLVASMLQKNECSEQEMKSEKIRINAESNEITPLIDLTLFNSSKSFTNSSNSSNNLVIDETMTDIDDTSPSNSETENVKQLEDNVFNLANAINEVEDNKCISQITPKKRGRKRKSECVSISESDTIPVVACKRSERLRAKQLILTNPFLSPVKLGNYTKRQNGEQNSSPETELPHIELSEKKIGIQVGKTDEKNENLSFQINLGFFKERISDETSTSTEETLNTNCDNSLKQQKIVSKIKPIDWSSFKTGETLKKTRLLDYDESPASPTLDTKENNFNGQTMPKEIPLQGNIQKIRFVSQSMFINDDESPASPTADIAETNSHVQTMSKESCFLTVPNNESRRKQVSQSMFVHYDESPASPDPDTAEINFHHHVPNEIPFELNPLYRPPKNNTLLKRLVNVYSSNKLDTSSYDASRNKPEQRAQIQTELRKYLLNKKNSTTMPTEITIKVEAEQLVYRLLQITNSGDIISDVIVEEMREVPRPEQELNCTVEKLAPNTLSLAHQRIAYAIHHLRIQRASFANELIEAIENVLFDIKSLNLNMIVSLNLTQLYLLAVGQLSLETPNPARLFIAKCLYFFKFKAQPIIYEVLCCYPTVLPHRDDRSYLYGSDAIVTVIQHALMCNKYEMERSELRPKELLSKLRFEYHFEPFKPDRSEVLTNLVEKLKAGRLTNLKYAFAVFCKRMSPQQVECMVLQAHLIPLAKEYYTRVQQSCSHDIVAAAVLDFISVVVKPFDIKTDVGVYLDLFGRFLNVVDRPVIQESAVQSVLRLQRFGTMNCYNVLANYAPNYEPQPITMAMLKTFVHRKHSNFWNNCAAEARMYAEH